MARRRWRRNTLIVGAVLIATVLVAPFFVSVPPLTDTVDPVTLADADSRFIEVNGLNVHYKEAGRGAPEFVLLHGFGASLFTWREVLPGFAELGRAIAYDRPAFGLTQRPVAWSGANPYGDGAQTTLALALLDALHVDRAVWVANSAGARVAVDVALRHPERVIALVLVDPALGAAPRWFKPVLNTPQMQHLGPRLVRSIATVGDDGIRRAWHDPSRITAEVYAGYHAPLKARDWDTALWNFTLADRDPAIDAGIAKLAVPALVITGSDDRIVPTQRTIELATRIPASELVVLADCGHLPQEECPGPFMDAVRQFVAGRAETR